MRRYHLDKVDANYIKEIRQFHVMLSNLETPKDYIKRIEATGVEYPKGEYMRSLQNKYFPTSSWTIEEKPIFNANKLVAWVVTGKLDWDYGYIGLPDIHRTGMMAAAHQVNYKKNGDLLDLGNDVKAANTDTWKKALNFYLDICDDVYRWMTPELSPKQISELLTRAELLKDEKRKQQVIKTVKGGGILLNKKNYSKWVNKLDYEISIQSAT